MVFRHGAVDLGRRHSIRVVRCGVQRVNPCSAGPEHRRIQQTLHGHTHLCRIAEKVRPIRERVLAALRKQMQVRRRVAPGISTPRNQVRPLLKRRKHLRQNNAARRWRRKAQQRLATKACHERSVCRNPEGRQIVHRHRAAIATDRRHNRLANLALIESTCTFFRDDLKRACLLKALDDIPNLSLPLCRVDIPHKVESLL